MPPWSHIGITIGYRLGYALGNQGHGLALLGASFLPKHHPALAKMLVAELDSLGAPGPINRLADGDERRLARCCWALALYETIFRAGPAINSPLYQLGARSKLRDLLELASAPWVDDVVALTDRAFEKLIPSFADVPLAARRPGVTFAGSLDVGGADGDLLVGSTLLEVKTALTVHADKFWAHQLVGYALLDYDDAWKISDVGFYLPRQGLLITWGLHSLLRRMVQPDLAAGLSRRPVDLNATRAALAERLRAARGRPPPPPIADALRCMCWSRLRPAPLASHYRVLAGWCDVLNDTPRCCRSFGS